MQVIINESGEVSATDEQTVEISYSKSVLESQKAQFQSSIDTWTQRIADIQALLDSMDAEVQAGRATDLRPVQIAPTPAEQIKP